MMRAKRKIVAVCLLAGFLGSRASAVEIEPIVSACAPRYAESVVLGKLKEASWLPIAEEEFPAFAPMLADAYLHEPYDSVFSPLKPGDDRATLVGKVMGMRGEYQDPRHLWKILKNTNDPAAFLVVRGSGPSGENAPPSACILYADEGSYSVEEVQELVGDSPKRLTSLGFRQVALVRNENGNQLYKLEAQVADDPKPDDPPIQRPRAKLILTVGTFKNE